MIRQPYSIDKINLILSDLQNTIQDHDNYKKNLKLEIEYITKEIKIDLNFSKELREEKDLYVESICEQTLKNLSNKI